jgi:uncharacterized membrane protein YfcA
MTVARALLGALAVVTVAFSWFWVVQLRAGGPFRWPSAVEAALGFVIDFLDTLGIGSFATTTSAFRLMRLVPDEEIPGTLNVGHAIPTFAEAFVSIAIFEIDGRTLVLMIAASVLGAWLGAGRVTKWPRRRIQIGMGAALLVAAAFFVMRNLGLFPPGGDALGITGWKLAIGVLFNFIFGALMTLGIGAYAPCMILTSLLGMNPTTAYPIMMGSCAFLMPAASIRFIREKRYAPSPSVGLTLGGTPGVLVAAFVIKSLNLVKVRWLVTAVVLYTAVSMLRSARAEAAGRKTR